MRLSSPVGEGGRRRIDSCVVRWPLNSVTQGMKGEVYGTRSAVGSLYL